MLMRRHSGFSLLELMLTVTIFAIMVLVAVPNFATWLQNTKVRTAAESLQNALRTAKTYATQNNRIVTVNLSTVVPTASSVPGSSTLSSAGTNWFSQTVTLMTGENQQYLQGGNLGDSRITVTGPTTICFSASGKLTTAPGASPAPSCQLPSSGNGILTYTISNSLFTSSNGNARPLKVTVSDSGAVRMCDPAKTYSSTTPDGCFANY